MTPNVPACGFLDTRALAVNIRADLALERLIVCVFLLMRMEFSIALMLYAHTVQP